MFEEPRKEPSPTPATKAHHDRKLFYALGSIIVLLIIMVTFLTYQVLTLRNYTIPENIIKEVNYTIFVPEKLPNGYKVVEGSFTVSEGTLIFRTEDASGSSIAFTEQKKPDNFDFEKFHKEQLRNPKTLSEVPYPSVIGMSPTGDKLLLSVITDDTWILVSTAAPLGQQDFTRVAKGLKEY